MNTELTNMELMNTELMEQDWEAFRKKNLNKSYEDAEVYYIKNLRKPIKDISDNFDYYYDEDNYGTVIIYALNKNDDVKNRIKTNIESRIIILKCPH